MKSFITSCDMGAIKIFTKDVALFFNNGIGDLPTTVRIYERPRKYAPKGAEFIEHFTVKSEAYLSGYDCEDDPIYTFKKGRWFVFLHNNNSFDIVWTDNEVHA